MLWQASAPDSSNSANIQFLIAYIFKPCISDCIPYHIIKPFFRSQLHVDADIAAHQKPSISYKTAYSNSPGNHVYQTHRNGIISTKKVRNNQCCGKPAPQIVAILQIYSF